MQKKPRKRHSDCQTEEKTNLLGHQGTENLEKGGGLESDLEEKLSLKAIEEGNVLLVNQI